MATTEDHATRLRELAGAGGPVGLEEVHALFDALAPVGEDELIGEWNGGLVPTGHPGEAQLDQLGWIGKTFRSRDDVDPIVCRGADGGREANSVLGAASIRMVEHRGVVTATMVYDRHPIFDHFRRAGDGLLLGLMDRKGEERPLAFYLSRA